VAEAETRIEIAFQGGQTIGAIVSSEAVDGLRAALDGSGGDGAYELQAEDGTYIIPLRAVVYVKRFSRETHIGFGHSG
jgi:hypothetical protein